MNKTKYELIFRGPENIMTPYGIELLLKGGYGEIDFFFVHGVPNVEIYVTEKEAALVARKGLELYSNKNRTVRLIKNGDINSFKLNEYVKYLKTKNLSDLSNNKLKKIFIRLNYVYVRFLKYYSFTEYIYFKEIEKKIFNSINSKVNDLETSNKYESILLNCSKNLKRKKLEIEKKLGLPDDIKTLVDLVALISHKKFQWRKTMNTTAHFLFKVNKEISRRFYLSLSQVECCYHDEIVDLFGREVDMDGIFKRRSGFIVYQRKGEICMLQGKRAKELISKIKPESMMNVDSFRGDVVSVGKAKGKVVKFTFGFDPEEMNKIKKKINGMKKGDILVTESTGPELIMACKKAAAIITEEGGINSHAAIISRELKIPCIVNTKIATEILKDGDMVEVDAVKGVVTIINKY
jgi:phosphohistidine swiveling domain-containing protein